MWVRNLANTWTALGVRPGMPPEQVARIRMANGIAILNGVLAGLTGLMTTIAKPSAVGLSLLIVPIGVAFLLYTAYRGHTNLSRALIAPILSLCCFLVALLAGREVVTAIPFMLVLVPFSVFGLNEKGWLFSSLFVVCAVSLPVLVPGVTPDAVAPLDAEASFAIQTVVVFCVFLTMIALMFLSVVARAEATKALEAARSRAESADKTKSLFLANMSHEIRTPLTAIIGYTQLIDEAELPNAERSAAARTVQRNGRHLLQLVNQILDLSKIEAGELLLEPQNTSLEGILADVMSLFRVHASDKGLDLSLTFETKIPRTLYTDQLRLKQILVNLLGNAIKFTDQGTIHVEVAIRRTEGRTLSIAISDTGAGIPEWELERMFRPFVRGELTGHGRRGGTGLGLAI